MDKKPTFTKTADKAALEFLRSVSCGSGRLPGVSILQSLTDVGHFFADDVSSFHLPHGRLKYLTTLLEGVPLRLWSEYCLDPTGKDWLVFAEAWCRMPYQDLRGKFRTFYATYSDPKFLCIEEAALKADAMKRFPALQSQDVAWAVPYLGTSSRFVIEKSRYINHLDILEYSLDGKFETISGVKVATHSVKNILPTLWSSDMLRTFLSCAKSKPLNIPTVEFFQALANDVQATAAEVATVWFGPLQSGPARPKSRPGIQLPIHLSKACKLTARECSAASETLLLLPPGVLKARAEAALAGDPSELWMSPPTAAADRLRKVWTGKQRERLSVPIEWISKLTDVLEMRGEKLRFLEALNSPQDHPMFSNRGRWFFEARGYAPRLICDNKDHEFNNEILRATVICMAMLANGLPVGDPGRLKMGEVYAATLKALKNPDLLLEGATRMEYGPGRGTALLNLAQSTVGPLQPHQAFHSADDRIAVVAVNPTDLSLAFRPAKLTTDKRIERLVEQIDSIVFAPGEKFTRAITPALNNVQYVRSAEFSALITRIAETPVPNGGYEANPMLSAPAIIKKVVNRLKLSREAAAYYLQLLTLPDPTDKNVIQWNGWTSAIIKTLGQELLARDLIVEDSRPRAGRKFFLPGGWEKVVAPDLPLETWKMPLFDLDHDYYERAVSPCGRILPLSPVHELFQDAWNRILEGDLPGEEDIDEE